MSDPAVPPVPETQLCANCGEGLAKVQEPGETWRICWRCYERLGYKRPVSPPAPETRERMYGDFDLRRWVGRIEHTAACAIGPGHGCDCGANDAKEALYRALSASPSAPNELPGQRAVLIAELERLASGRLPLEGVEVEVQVLRLAAKLLGASPSAPTEPSERNATELVSQRESWDCAFACLAMVSGLSYEAVTDRIGSKIRQTAREHGGLPNTQIPAVLGILGLATRTVFNGAPEAIRLRGLRLASVGGHYIVILPDDRVLDPARGLRAISDYGPLFQVWEIHASAPTEPSTRTARRSASERAPCSAGFMVGDNGDERFIAGNDPVDCLRQMRALEVAESAAPSSGETQTAPPVDAILAALAAASEAKGSET